MNNSFTNHELLKVKNVFHLGKKFACHGVILSSQSIVFAQAIEYAYREQRKNQARPCIGEYSRVSC